MPFALNEKNAIVHNTKETRERGEPDGLKPDTKRGQPGEQPAKPDAKDSLVNKIQQLGETTLPQMGQDTNIHCLTIIGQIEGHVQLPPKIKQQNMNT